MHGSNAAFDRADELAEKERESGIKAASRALSGSGGIDCSDCGKPIPAGRRAALPSATRCTECQEIYETQQAAR